MNRHVRLTLLVLLLVGLTVAPSAQTRQSGETAPLFQKIVSLDVELFGAVNACNMEKVASLFSPDVEFYHDKGEVTLGARRWSTRSRRICVASGVATSWPGRPKSTRWIITARCRSAFTCSVRRERSRVHQEKAVRRSSFTSGTTKTAFGRSRAYSLRSF